MSTMRSLAFGAALACLGGVVVPAFAQMSGAVGREVRSVAGLDAPAEILIDH